MIERMPLEITPEEALTLNVKFRAEDKIRLQERKRIMKWLEQFERFSLSTDTKAFRIFKVPTDELEKLIREGNVKGC